MGYHLLNVLTLVFLITCAPHANWATNPIMSGAERSSIEDGLAAGDALATVLKDGDFTESLKKIATKLSPFLNVLGPLVGIALAFIPSGDSAELALLREQFAEVNNKLDIVTSEFTEVKNAISWNTVVISYDTYERKIRAAEVNLHRIYQFEGQIRENKKDNFITQYETDFDNSVQKLYDVIVNNDHVISENILDAVVQQTKNHKRKVEQFSLGLMQLLVRGIKVKVSYYGLKGYNVSHVVTEWQTKMNTMKAPLQTLSNTIKGRYKRQMTTDVGDLILRHHSLGNQRLMDRIYDFVTDKYDWRFWFVAIYNDVRGDDSHNYFQCSGATFLHQHNKNVIIASREKTASTFNRRNANQLLRNTAQQVYASRVCPLTDHRARILVEKMRSIARATDSCTPYAMGMAVKDGYDLVHRSEGSHTAYLQMRNAVHCVNSVSFSNRRPYTTWEFKIIVFG